jgi:hypothetical protein
VQLAIVVFLLFVLGNLVFWSTCSARPGAHDNTIIICSWSPMPQRIR